MMKEVKEVDLQQKMKNKIEKEVIILTMKKKRLFV